jgi:hypothetical protein
MAIVSGDRGDITILTKPLDPTKHIWLRDPALRLDRQDLLLEAR